MNHDDIIGTCLDLGIKRDRVNIMYLFCTALKNASILVCILLDFVDLGLLFSFGWDYLVFGFCKLPVLQFLSLALPFALLLLEDSVEYRRKVYAIFAH